MRMPVAGGPPTLVTTGSLNADVRIAVGIGSIFVANDAPNGALLRCPDGACPAPQSIATNADGLGAVTLGPTHLAWSTSVVPGTVYQALPDGTFVDTLVVGPPDPDALAYDDEHLYWLNAGPYNNATGEFDQGSVMRCPQVGGLANCGASGPETLATGLTTVRSLVTDTNAIYWVSAGKLWRLAK
jgi:hypothetical protein